MVKKNENISAGLEMCDFCINTHNSHYYIILFAATASGARYDIRGGNSFFRRVFCPFLYPYFA